MSWMNPKPSGNAKHRHHFVPRSYLREFAEKNEQLLAILREPYEVRSVRVGGVAVERDFYKIRRADGSQCDDLEDALAEFDALIPEIVRKATSDEELEPVDAADLRTMYAILIARGQLGRDSLIAEVAAMRERIAREFQSKFPDESADHHAPLLDGVIRGVFEHPEQYAADPETVSRLALLQLAADFEASMPRYVCVMESPELEFITSDAPFAWFDPERRPDAGEVDGLRFRAPRVELTMPIGRRHAILFANIAVPARAHVNDYTAAVVNSRTAFFARRMALSHHSEEAGAVLQLSVVDYRSLYQVPLLDAFEAKADAIAPAGRQS